MNLLDALRKLGVRVPAHVRNRFMVLCPFHDDKNPSLSVDLTKNVWYCFACQVGGTTADLLRRAGLRIAPTTPQRKVLRTPTKSHANPSIPYSILDELTQHSLYAIRYLASRGISLATARTFSVLGLTQSNFHFAPLRPYQNYCIVPLFSPNNKLVQFYGRATSNSLTPAHRYLSGYPLSHAFPHFIIPLLKKQRTFFVTESIIDAMALFELGFHNVIPLYGVNNYKHLFSVKQGSTFIFALDNDEVGQQATQSLIRTFQSRYRTASFTIPFPQFKDFAEITKSAPLSLKYQLVMSLESLQKCCGW